MKRFPRTIALIPPLASCAPSPVTRERDLAFISEERDITFGVYDDAELQKYVNAIGYKLAESQPRLMNAQYPEGEPEAGQESKVVR